MTWGDPISMNVLGLSYMYHDSAAVLVRDGRVAAAAEEERFSRLRHCLDFPSRAVEWCLADAGLGAEALDAVAFYEKPYLKFERVLRTHLAMWPRSWPSFRRFLPMWLGYKLPVARTIRERLGRDVPVMFIDHHTAHAASAFLPSPFERAMIVTLDGTGEWSTLCRGTGEGEALTLTDEARFPHSYGLLYSAVTAHLGFEVNEGEGKVMGLAAHGRPDLLKELRTVADVRGDGSLRLDLDYFAFHHDLVMTNERFRALLGPARAPGAPVTDAHKSLAASLQALLEDAAQRMVRDLHARTGLTDLCLAGGVALNCAMNAGLLEHTPVKRLFIQPAAGDSGAALGAALYASGRLAGGSRRWRMEHAFLGPEYDEKAIESALVAAGASFRRFEPEALVEEVSGRLAAGQVLGWFQGRMEWGPRALGHRSILADPRDPDMQRRVNSKVKRRESFRPFAPAMPLEDAGRWFEKVHESPFMTLALPVRPERRAEIPSVVHVDGTARLQTVRPGSDPYFHSLLRSFGRRTGVPVLLNTSFNGRREPIVCSPDDAVACHRSCGLDALAIGPFLAEKLGEEHEPTRL